MSKEIKELILKILDKAMEVSDSTVSDISVDFSSSSQHFGIRIYGEGYKKTDGKVTYYYYTFLDMDRALEDLNRMYSEICKYEKA